MSGILRERNEILKIQAEFKELKNKANTSIENQTTNELTQANELAQVNELLHELELQECEL